MSDRFAGVVDGLAELKLLPETELATFVVGSMARGWDHGASDLDINVVSTEQMTDDRLLRHDVPLLPETLPVLGFERDGLRWELKYWTDDQIDQLLAKVSWEAFEGDGKVNNRLAEVEELFLGRLINCVPLTGQDWVDRRREQIRESAFAAFVISYALTMADSKAESAMGQLAAGDAHCATLTAREAFGHAVDGLAASHGEFGVLVKWRARRLRTAAPKLLSFEQYWSIETMRTFDPADPGAWVREVVGVCKRLTSEIEF